MCPGSTRFVIVAAKAVSKPIIPFGAVAKPLAFSSFDIARFLSVRLKPRPNEVYDVFEVDVSEEDPGSE